MLFEFTWIHPGITLCIKHYGYYILISLLTPLIFYKIFQTGLLSFYEIPFNPFTSVDDQIGM